MQKLLFLLPLTLCDVEAAPVNAPKELTAILNVPAGAKTMVLNFDGITNPPTIFKGTRQLVVQIIATPEEVRYTWKQKSWNDSPESSSSHQGKFLFTSIPAAKKMFKPPLNSWTPLWMAQQASGWTCDILQFRRHHVFPRLTRLKSLDVRNQFQ